MDGTDIRDDDDDDIQDDNAMTAMPMLMTRITMMAIMTLGDTMAIPNDGDDEDKVKLSWIKASNGHTQQVKDECVARGLPCGNIKSITGFKRIIMDELGRGTSTKEVSPLDKFCSICFIRS